MQAPSGRQVELRHGDQRAVVVEVGGGLREYVVAGEPVVDGYPVDRMADGGRGMPLIPWPNRLADGSYELDGQRYQLPINEVPRQNASHGLTGWLNWSVAEQSPAGVRMQLLLYPRPGYPFSLELSIDYTLDDDGLRVRTTAANVGTTRLPFGSGQHPYFTVGTPVVDTAILRVPAEQVVELDPQRRLPTGARRPVTDSVEDFLGPRPIGESVLDACYTGLIRDADGCARATLQHPDGGRGLTVWVDHTYRYLQVFSGDTLPAARRRQGLAIEPMTCPPNAFRTGDDLVILEPGQSHVSTWGVSPHLTADDRRA